MRALIASWLLATLAVLPAAPAAAAGSLQLLLQPSGVCKASSGAGSTYFYFANEYLENVTAGSQYILCGAPVVKKEGTSFPYPVDGSLSLDGEVALVNNSSLPVDFVCVGMVGWESTSTYFSAFAGNVTLAPYATGNFVIPAGSLPVTSTVASFVLNCRVPTGGRLQSIRINQPRNF